MCSWKPSRPRNSLLPSRSQHWRCSCVATMPPRSPVPTFRSMVAGPPGRGVFGAEPSRSTSITRPCSGIPEFKLLAKAQGRAPTRSLMTLDDVGKAVAFLALDGAKLMTGDTIYIDGGYHIID